MISIQVVNKLVAILEQRLEYNLSPSIFVNVSNPKGSLTKDEIKHIHSEFIENIIGKNDGKEIDPEQPYDYRQRFGKYELVVEKLYSVDDNILLISLTPATVVNDAIGDLLSDLPLLKETMIEELDAVDVTIKVTY